MEDGPFCLELMATHLLLDTVFTYMKCFVPFTGWIERLC